MDTAVIEFACGRQTLVIAKNYFKLDETFLSPLRLMRPTFTEINTSRFLRIDENAKKPVFTSVQCSRFE